MKFFQDKLFATLLSCIFIFICSIDTVKGQTLKETVVYINDLLKNNGYRLPFPEAVGKNNEPEYDAYDQIEISDDGKFIIKRNLYYYKTKEKTISSSVTSYLKQIMYLQTKEFDSYYSISLKTKSVSSYFLVTSHSDGSTIGRS